EESITLMTPYRFPHHGNRFFAIALGNVFRSSSSCRFLFPIDNHALSQNRHSAFLADISQLTANS
ncbi:hypothetical protein, partial [Dialister invisus]